jgi:D-alanyl-lipoteichoic acid acyltransferase DltB (MBOAT superfamily)
MRITSILFLTLSALAIVINFWLPQRIRKYWLLVLSILFCASWSIPFCLILLALSSLLLGLGLLIQKSIRSKKIWLWVGIVLFVAALLVFKYFHFFTADLNRLLGEIFNLPFLASISLFVPIGLSFLVLQAISYLIDVYHQRLEASRDWVKVTLYLLYFPKLLSGPIERSGSFFKQSDSPVTVDWETVDKNITLIIMGLIRKVLFANPLLAMIPNDAFTNPANLQGTFLLGYLFIYAWGLYNDFAGYSDIARGISGLFGIELLKNFDFPYASKNITEFWQRWHISLSSYLRDYIYFPLSRWMLKKDSNHQHIQNIIIPPLVTMLISGLWHGLAWNTLLWGGLYGLFLAIDRLILLKHQGKPENTGKVRRCFSVVFTFILVMLLWIPFRMELPVTGAYLRSALSTSNLIQPVTNWFSSLVHATANRSQLLTALLTFRIPILLIITILCDWLLFRKRDELAARKLPGWAQAVLLGVALLFLFLLSFSSKQPLFIYQGF